MCMYVDDEFTEEMAMKFAVDGTKSITVWKWVLFEPLSNPDQNECFSPYYHYIWSVGEHKAKQPKKLKLYQINCLDFGVFHAYPIHQTCVNKLKFGVDNPNATILALQVNVEDIVGYSNFERRSEEIAFRKCTVTEESYKKACTRRM